LKTCAVGASGPRGGLCMGIRLLLLAAVAVSAVACNQAERQSEVQSSLERTLSGQTRPAYVTPAAEGKKLWKLTQQFYNRRNYEPAWIKGTSPLPHVAELIKALNSASEEGL